MALGRFAVSNSPCRWEPSQAPEDGTCHIPLEWMTSLWNWDGPGGIWERHLESRVCPGLCSRCTVDIQGRGGHGKCPEHCLLGSFPPLWAPSDLLIIFRAATRVHWFSCHYPWEGGVGMSACCFPWSVCSQDWFMGQLSWTLVSLSGLMTFDCRSWKITSVAVGGGRWSKQEEGREEERRTAKGEGRKGGGKRGGENMMKEFSCTPSTDISEPVAYLLFNHLLVNCHLSMQINLSPL